MKPLGQQVTEYIKAGDLASAREATERVKNSSDPEKELWRIGSYARFQWAVENLSEDRLLELLPELWVGADPNDADPKYLELWKKASSRRKSIITDGKDLPKKAIYIVYRGQIGDGVGISWTLDKNIAMKFARTGGGRLPVPGGRVLKKTIKREQILAYLTSRGESEIILILKGNKFS